MSAGVEAAASFIWADDSGALLDAGEGTKRKPVPRPPRRGTGAFSGRRGVVRAGAERRDRRCEWRCSPWAEQRHRRERREGRPRMSVPAGVSVASGYRERVHRVNGLVVGFVPAR